MTTINNMKAQTDSLVLVVDDDPASLRLSEQILLAAGYWNVHLFSDPREVTKAVEPLKVDLVISDLQMPDVDGFSLLKSIKESVPEGEFLPVLVVTADATTESRRKALLLGADDFLTKPIDVVEMTLRVRHLLQLRTLHTALSNSRHELASQVEDRTAELRAAMDRLENLVKAKDVFIAGVSHELRTPLTAVLGFANELASNTSVLSREEVADAARTISEQATHLAAIIDNLLVAARADIDAVQMFREEVDVKKELDVVAQGIPLVDRERIQFPATGLMVQGDRLRVRQILRNLLTNALRHGGDMIRIEFARSPGVGTITVTDDGPGIPPELADQLFEPYQRGQGDAGQPASIGLGLTVSRFLARLMDGDIELVSHPDGTSFALSLPTGRR